MTSLEDFTQLQIPSVIYKDDCGYCFETLHNESQTTSHALHICLDCFQSFCKSHVPLHQCVTKKEFARPHDFLLKVSKCKKAEQSQPIEKKLKLEVMERSEDDIYDSLWWLMKGNDIIADYKSQDLEADVQNKVAQILNARSNTFQRATESWQLEIKPCTHVTSFETPVNKSECLSDVCVECKLGSNLWLCLHCGNVGCGRQQVGIEGYSHALTHFEENPEHPLAVKLGSLSNTSADIYCYFCDDEVQFQDLDKWHSVLEHWGINIRDKVAQEKSLVELQVEQNVNWDFQMVDSQGHELHHLRSSKRYGCGLLNLGNSCYMNAVLQVLFNGGVSSWSLDELGDFPTDVVYVSSNLKCQLIKLRNALRTNPEMYSNGVKPSTFKDCVGGTHEEFSSGRQQDALEFFSYLIDLLDKKLFNRSEFHPNDLMKFSLQDRIECTSCHGVKYVTQVSDYLQVPLPESDDPQMLITNLERYLQGETVEFSCPKCNRVTEAVKSSGLQTYPETLVVSCSRIKLVNWVPTKTSQEVTMPGIDAADTSLLQLGHLKSNGFNSETEHLLPEDESPGFKAKPHCVSQLMEMGFTENASIRALYHTGNSDTDSAMNWLFQHVEDDDINELFVAPNAPSKPSEVNPQALESMVSMGLNPDLCHKALVLHKGNVSASVEWVFNNADNTDDTLLETQDGPDSNSYGISDETKANFRLSAVICHKGSSVHSGHYVAFIKKDVENETKWVLYNDEKMVVADDPSNITEIKKNGYIYLFSRC